MNISQFFRKDPDTNTEFFIGEKLEIFISTRYENFKCLKMEKSLVSIGIFDMIINDKYEDSLFAPCLLEMEPSVIETVKIDDEPFVKATFRYGDVFIKSTVVQQIQALGYVIFYELISQANRSKHLDYFKIVKIFDKIKTLAGVNFNVNRKTFELICAHIHRDKTKMSTFYRQTPMTEPPVIIQFKDIAHGTVTTTGKIIGSYFKDSLRSAIVDPNEDYSEIENIMRS